MEGDGGSPDKPSKVQRRCLLGPDDLGRHSDIPDRAKEIVKGLSAGNAQPKKAPRIPPGQSPPLTYVSRRRADVAVPRHAATARCPTRRLVRHGRGDDAVQRPRPRHAAGRRQPRLGAVSWSNARQTYAFFDQYLNPDAGASRRPAPAPPPPVV